MRVSVLQRTRMIPALAVSIVVLCATVGCATPMAARSDVQLAPGISFNSDKHEVTIAAQVAARQGWLEQIVCKAGTREHESLLASQVPPRLIHAAMLAAGFVPGAPGSWQEVPDAKGNLSLVLVPPTGERVELLVRYRDTQGVHELQLVEWVHGIAQSAESPQNPVFPSDRFVFAGSSVRPNPPSLGPGEHYVADYTGSIVGLVTFGDEVIAFSEVIPDRVDVVPPVWEAWTSRMPPEGTAVELIVRRQSRATR